MTDDLEDRITRTLTEAAETGPGLDLLPTVTDRGRRLRRRRRVAFGATTAAVVAVVAVAGAPTVLDRPSDHRAMPGGAPSATASVGASPSEAPSGRILAPPAATGQKTVQADPSVLASDPMLIHLGLTWTPPATHSMTWQSDRINTGVETVRVDAGGLQLAVTAAHSRKAVGNLRAADRSGTTTIGGHQATLYREPGQWSVVWQPRPGVWIDATGRSRAEAVRIAAGVRLDAVYQCSLPARLGSAPAGAALRSCEIGVDWYDGAPHYAAKLYVHAAERTIDVSFSDMHSQMPADEADGTCTIQGRSGIVLRRNGFTTMRVTGLHGFNTVEVGGNAPDGPLLAVANGLHVTGVPDRPETWSTRPFTGG
ncbi:hypothetical protein [Actinocatenispora sera]|uniref:Uncharacterized protein n=1 Tax=Actinocatenispora sera TaxID=390989 RepID=A0A810L310_9ACTN|nr:hypothetical protein [Actinocatenispora sera]BCJ29844.1 hypothetical protein Asera_39520 [Actinocatenispora sera]